MSSPGQPLQWSPFRLEMCRGTEIAEPDEVFLASRRADEMMAVAEVESSTRLLTT